MRHDSKGGASTGQQNVVRDFMEMSAVDQHEHHARKIHHELISCKQNMTLHSENLRKQHRPITPNESLIEAACCAVRKGSGTLYDTDLLWWTTKIVKRITGGSSPLGLELELKMQFVSR